MRTRTLSLVATLATLAVTTALLHASSPAFWIVATQADFLKGQVENLMVDTDGRVVLGSALERIADPGVPALWATVSAPDGTRYVAAGHDGRVYRLDANGRPVLALDTEELDVYALAVAPDGTLFAGTSPDGRIYRLPPRGSSSVLFDPDDKYIWSLALSPDGTLYAATGEHGAIYQIPANGQGRLFYSTRATHVMALAFDRDGQLLAGTASPGRVFRIDRNAKGFVLLDSPFKEIRSIRVDAQGVIFAAAVGGAPETPKAAETTSEAARPIAVPAVTAEISAITVIDTGAGAQAAPAARPEIPSAAKGAIYRVQADGLWDVRWESAEDQPYDLVVDANGVMTIATGNGGKIFRVAGEPAIVSLLGRADAQQITRLQAESDGRLTVLTANPGRVFRLTRDRAARGTYVSEVRDAGTIASWGTIAWRASGGGRVEIATRSGNTSTPDDTWSDWSTPYANAIGDQIRSPKARFLQWRAALVASDRAEAAVPVLTSVTAAYLARNRRPVVSAITVHPPGTAFQRPFPTSDQVEVAGLDTTPLDGRPGQAPGPPAVAQPPAPPLGRRLYQKGLQTFTWTARDADDDTLQYDVRYRRDGDTSWKTLKAGLWDAILVWDTTSVPDGSYTVRVVVSDAPANAADTALNGEAESQVFDIDNTAPRLEVGKPVRTGAAMTIAFTVRDDQSPIRRVEYSLDGDRWRIVHPRDGIPDSRVEEFELRLEADVAVKGVIVRATDAMNNVASAQVGR